MGEIVLNIYVWMSLLLQNNNDWMDEVGEVNCDYYVVKIVSYLDDMDIIVYLFYDDSYEDNYQCIYGLSQFE